MEDKVNYVIRHIDELAEQADAYLADGEVEEAETILHKLDEIRDVANTVVDHLQYKLPE